MRCSCTRRSQQTTHGENSAFHRHFCAAREFCSRVQVAQKFLAPRFVVRRGVAAPAAAGGGPDTQN
jgi:hypothetical protein